MPVVQTALSIFWTFIGVICALFALWFIGSAYIAPDYLEAAVPQITDAVQNFARSAENLAMSLADKIY